MKKLVYPTKFYDNRNGSLKSAGIIVPMVMKFINPLSVIDFGCGNGSFLYVFKKNGVKKIYGIDGPWIKKEQLLISEKEFSAINLEKFRSSNEKFDLAISLEVAEHLSKKSADQFIKNITRQSNIVLFPAAIPLQGGVNHINEQWQTYWINIFKKYGYVPIDYFREKLWDNDDVSFWFAQNMFLFVKQSYLKNNLKLKKEFDKVNGLPFSIVHPKLFYSRAKRYAQICSIVPNKLKRIFKFIIR